MRLGTIWYHVTMNLPALAALRRADSNKTALKRFRAFQPIFTVGLSGRLATLVVARLRHGAAYMSDFPTTTTTLHVCYQQCGWRLSKCWMYTTLSVILLGKILSVIPLYSHCHIH